MDKDSRRLRLGIELFGAVVEGNFERVKTSVIDGADVNERDRYGMPVLALAALNGHEEIVKFLVRYGANVNEMTPADGKTALICASMCGRRDIVEYLIRHGALIDVGTFSGATALMHAAKYGCKAVVECLIENGADVTKRDYRGANAGTFAQNEEIRGILEKAMRASRTQSVAALMDPEPETRGRGVIRRILNRIRKGRAPSIAPQKGKLRI